VISAAPLLASAGVTMRLDETLVDPKIAIIADCHNAAGPSTVFFGL
jgi:hypothetical protein